MTDASFYATCKSTVMNYFSIMKRLLSFLRINADVFVVAPKGGDDMIPGFSWGIVRPHENELVARDGESLLLPDTVLYLGNNMIASLRRNAREMDKVKIGDIFPKQNVVVAVAGESLLFFAPICKTKRELACFIADLENFCSHYPDMYEKLQDNCEKLALWLYKHNAHRESEPDWGI